MNGMMIMILGFIAGAVIASGVWAVVWALLKNGNRADKNRSEAMEDIASQCADIENKIVALSTKSISEAAFRSLVSPVLEKITLSLSTNMDSFDVYYVKYVESLISRFRRSLIAPVKNDQAVKDEGARIIPPEKPEEFSVPITSGKSAPESPEVKPREEDLDNTLPLEISKESPQKATDETLADISFDKAAEKFSAALDIEDLPVTPPAGEPPAAALVASDQETGPEPIFEKVSSDDKTRDTKIIKTENIPEEKQTEIEKIIIAELNREPEEERRVEKPFVKESDAVKQPLESGTEFYDIPPSRPEPQEERIFEKKEKKTKSPPPPPKDESFISGEDLVEKLDSFFGFKE